MTDRNVFSTLKAVVRWGRGGLSFCSLSLKIPGLGSSPDALLSMKSHEIQGQVLKTVGPLIIFVQLLF